MSPPNPPPVAKEVASARKRRRRAPAGGAADDCFTCAKRNVKCDRRRPYCSQCLEIGNECSGYKTQLTWGVGVASRGKLRGLSLPIAKAPPVSAGKKEVPLPAPARLRTGSTASSTQWTEHDEKSEGRRPELPLSPGSSVPPTPFYEMPHISSPETTTAIPPSHGWTHVQYPPAVPADALPHMPRYQSRQIHASVPPPGDMLPPMMDSITEVNFMSPLDSSFRREDMHFIHSPTIMYENTYPGHSSPVPVPQSPAIMMESQRVPTTCPSLVYSPSEPSSSLHSSSLHSHVENGFDAQISSKMMDCDALKLEHGDFSAANSLIRKMSVSAATELDAYATSAQSQGPFWAPSTAEEDAQSQTMQEHTTSPWQLTIPRPPQSPSIQVNVDLISRMPFFMDYYENTLCPSMVFIDTLNNPFREHILRLSTSSRSLQHAICALAACNLRMKRKLSRGQHGRDPGEKRMDSMPTETNDTQPEDQSLTEEYQHRNLAVQLLNEQLNDNDKAIHDSVLATILLLCHYRMAESGVAKFQTQFAGVKKIIGMRRNSLFPASRESAWMECLFTYFDAVSASINDRETQLNTAFYGVLPDVQLLPPGAENLVGCDRELFKTVSKLGRLNLLSQHRPVQNLLSSPAQVGVTVKRSDSPLSSLGNTFHSSADQLSFDSPMFSPAVTSPSNRFGPSLNDEDMMNTASLQSPGVYDDHRSAFWREWKDARLALQSWEYDASRVAASLPGLPTPPTSSQLRDLGSLSEAFRYAALLYTERLASPNLPSAHTNFRNLVSQVVYYATSLEAGSNAEKFLLWPLFVAGSECVNELQQSIVRSKCRDIMARSGYMNNLSALDVLERLWAGDWKEEPPRMLPGGMMRRGPFNWTKCIGGPGVDVEWIMF